MIDPYPANALTNIWSHKLSEKKKEREYTMASVKAVLTLSQSVAGFMPVPLLRDAIGVALKIIQLCEVHWILP